MISEIGMEFDGEFSNDSDSDFIENEDPSEDEDAIISPYPDDSDSSIDVEDKSSNLLTSKDGLFQYSDHHLTNSRKISAMNQFVGKSGVSKMLAKSIISPWDCIKAFIT